jgi:hypothetical protein
VYAGKLEAASQQHLALELAAPAGGAAADARRGEVAVILSPLRVALTWREAEVRLLLRRIISGFLLSARVSQYVRNTANNAGAVSFWAMAAGSSAWRRARGKLSSRSVAYRAGAGG